VTVSEQPVPDKRKGSLPSDSASLLAQPGNGRSVIKYRKNQVILTQGDPADAVFYIQKGKLKVTVVSDRGKEAVAAILGPEEFFSEAT
jgi:CRP/FNR family cyclic AMP-dependent transcriptional regulator